MTARGGLLAAVVGGVVVVVGADDPNTPRSSLC